MDFYSRLVQKVDSMRSDGYPVSVAVVIDRLVSPPAQRRMLRSADVAVDTLLILKNGSLSRVGVDGVPTVAVEQTSREWPQAWEGLQDSAGEREILSAVRRLGGNR